MLWSDRPIRLTGIILLILAVAILVSVVGTISVGDNDPFQRDKVDDYLVDIEDNKGLVIVGLAFGLIGHLGFGIVAAPAMYLLFRDRGNFVALAGLAFAIVAQAAFLVSDAAYNTTINLASDFAEGGPEGFAAGDPAIVRDARSIAILDASAQLIAITALALFGAAFGAIISWAPFGDVNPPRWIGWVAVAAGVTGVLTWLVTLSDAGGIFFGISGLLTLIWLVALGVWLVTRAGESTAATPVRA
jgi:hypothetical protein